jgi:biofilm PGA synthesis N-glycosyltransferase PgaC
MTATSFNRREYVLLTAAYNEEAYVEETIRSVLAQVVRPCAWAIVSDGSSDRTDEIVKEYAKSHPFIYFVRRERDENRRFGSKVLALRAGWDVLAQKTVPYVGHLDADISMEPSYFSDLLRKFEEDPKLGIAGGWCLERIGREFREARGSNPNCVPGAIQMFSRKCYQEIGALPPSEYGGEDWYAEVAARIRGWRVRSFPELKVRHNRETGRGSRLRYCYYEGFMDFALGSHPIFELVKVGRRIAWRPCFIGALARLLGFLLAHIWGERLVPPEFVAFIRREQMARFLPALLRVSQS